MKKILTIACILTCAMMLFACDKLGFGTKTEEPEQQQTETDGDNGSDTDQQPEQKPLSIEVFVTFSNAGELILKQTPVTVTDTDNDGKITAEETFVAFHAANNKEFALSDGYINKIWSVATGSCMYYINDAMAYSISTEIKDGDFLNAYIMKDTTNWSDSYTYFTERTINAVKGEDIVLTLKNAQMDENWNTTMVPTAGAKITVNGADGESTTDAAGNVTVSFDAAGTYYISAVSDTATLVPTVSVITVK